MKTIYSMGKGKYITLDSYGESHENRRWSIAIALFSIIIATITASSLLGVDITDPSLKQHHDIQSRPGN
jgi:beta-lactamase regulating signal transducer with metallopeptidase domain